VSSDASCTSGVRVPKVPHTLCSFSIPGHKSVHTVAQAKWSPLSAQEACTKRFTPDIHGHLIESRDLLKAPAALLVGESLKSRMDGKLPGSQKYREVTDVRSKIPVEATSQERKSCPQGLRHLLYRLGYAVGYDWQHSDFALLRTVPGIHVFWHVTPHRTVLTDVAKYRRAFMTVHTVSLATESCYTVRWLGCVFSMKLCSCERWMPQQPKHEQLHYIWAAQVVLAGINVHRTLQITSL